MHEFTQRRETLNYRYGNINTPFQKAGQNEAGPLASLIACAKIWRIVTFISLCINFVLALILVVAINTPGFHVYIAEMFGNGYIERLALLNNYVNDPNEITAAIHK